MPEQTSLDFAKLRADVAIERAARRVERCDPGWIDRAVEYVRGYARWNHPARMPDGFTIEEIRMAIDLSRPFIEMTNPPDGRAWGAVTRRAIQLGIIERIPGSFRPTSSSNGSLKAVYRKGACA